MQMTTTTDLTGCSMNEFVDYVLDFYGDTGIYAMGVTREHILIATDIRIESRKDIEFQGDSLDREMIRDILIEMFGYKWPVAA
jgi:hypothetical protein